MNKRIVVGMSGGVDSAVAALLLKEQGYDVVGLFMHNWEEDERGGACTAADDWEDAAATAAHIGIPIYSVSFAREYMTRVFDYFLKEYEAGRTPNPDVLCNREIKFDAFLRYALDFGDTVATGHYCDIDHGGGRHARLMKAVDAAKDQTYFLNQVVDGQLDRVIFPLGKLKKPEVRAIAERAGLDAVAKKKDSTGICFIGERKFREFLSNYLPAKPGNIVDTGGNIVGRHSGLMYYTLGQRRGLNVGGKAGYEPRRWYVVAKDLSSNELIVSCGEGEELFSNELTTPHINYIGGAVSAETYRCMAKTRYRQPDQACTVYQQPGGGARVVFDQPQRAITPGQFVVLYDGNRCLGGGVIDVEGMG